MKPARRRGELGPRPPAAAPGDARDVDRDLTARVERWFRSGARPLPWRTRPRDPYLSLVSEFMLQQTQVARVLDHFGPFVARFPSVHSLARAPQRDVLALWSGLGYYRRARHLHGAARAIVREHGGRLPAELALLRRLPGVGPYTAGALASIVHGRPAPIVDGNVARVLLRVHGREATVAGDAPWLWARAAALVRSATDPAAFNEGLMELGATICTPRAARCALCPVGGLCDAYRDGRADEIPRPKAPGRRRACQSASLLATDGRGRVLVEQRPPTGMWASLWQAPTLERAGQRKITRSELESWAGLGPLELAGRFVHQTTHRRVHFSIWTVPTHRDLPGRRAWVWRSPAQLARLGLSNPQRRILAMASGRTSSCAPPSRPRTAQPARPRRGIPSAPSTSRTPAAGAGIGV